MESGRTLLVSREGVRSVGFANDALQDKLTPTLISMVEVPRKDIAGVKRTRVGVGSANDASTEQIDTECFELVTRWVCRTGALRIEIL